MPIYGKKRKRVGQTSSKPAKSLPNRKPKSLPNRKPKLKPQSQYDSMSGITSKPKPKPKRRSIPKDHPRRIQKAKKLDDTGRWAGDIKRVPKTNYKTKPKPKPKSLPKRTLPKENGYKQAKNKYTMGS